MKPFKKKTQKTEETVVEEVVTKKVEKYIVARIFDINSGLRVYENVNVVKIKSKYFTLAIMSDYTPSLGEIEGEVTLITDNDLIKLENLNAYFHHQNNSFSLLIKEQADS